MTRRAALGGLLMLLAIGLGGYFALSRVEHEPPEPCQICRRPIHPKQVFVLEFRQGARERTCCPRCGLHAGLRAPDQVRRAWATDFASGRTIPAERAVYVEGSAVMTCCRPTVLREPGVVYEPQWDRCLPSLIAFEREADAHAFSARYGGRVLLYADARASVQKR